MDNDLIQRAAARDVINTWGRHENEDVRMDLLHNDLNAIPAVDAAPVVHGWWIESENFKGYMVCSICHDSYVEPEWITTGKWAYCPNCGAKMDE